MVFDINKVHTWLQVSAIVGGLAWFGGAMDTRMQFMEEAQRAYFAEQKVYFKELIVLKKNQQAIATSLAKYDSTILRYLYTDKKYMVVTEPNGDPVRLVISPQSKAHEL